MADDENAWVFDSLVCFLNGPIWSAPLESFIEEKSLIFEPNNEDNEEYQKIFDEFKNLVDYMLGNFMEDIGITPEQFEDACNRGHSYPINFNRNIFEQIWAANDYEMFKRMMTQKNVELQLQALELIEEKYGITPQSFVPQKKDEKETIHTAVTIEKSNDLEREVMNEVVKNFPTEEQPSTANDVKYILEEKQSLEQSLKKAKEKVVEQEQQIIPTPPPPPPLPPSTSAEINFDKKPQAAEIPPAELKKRQEYLRAQRDKLVALKKEVRKKQFVEKNGATNERSKVRPKSAKAAEAVLTGDKATIEPQQLQLRKALAERLKTEVVSNKR